MTYYNDLVSDTKRVSVFKKVIQDVSHGIVYDLGTGSGILAEFASNGATRVYAIEQNPFVLKHTNKTFSKYNNITLIKANASNYVFPKKPDVIICEMLDTALIDEEQVPVINNAQKYKKDSTIFIPKAVYTTMEIVSANISHITYYENKLPCYDSFSDEIKYHYVDFSKKIDDTVEMDVLVIIRKDGLVNAIKLTTYTILSDNIICEPTSMLNPPILIPVPETRVSVDDEIIINIKYVMGGGLNTIQTSIRRNK